MHQREQDLLIEICRNFALARDTVIPNDVELDFAYLLQSASAHRIMPLVSNVVIANGRKSELHRKGLDTAYYESILVARNRAQVFADEVQRIAESAHRAGLKPQFRKGVVYSRRFFNGSPLRTLNDIDLFVKQSDASCLINVLANLGYQTGWYSRAADQIMPLSRKQELEYLLYPTHAFPMVRRTDIITVPAIKVDIAMALDWPNSSIGQASDALLEEILKSSAEDRSTGPDSDNWFHFLDCSLHLFREAYFENKGEAEHWRGVNLKKFTDILAIANSLSGYDRDRIKYICANPYMNQVISWVVLHTEILMSSSLNMNDSVQLDNKIGLNNWSRPGGNIAQWNGTMKDRLFSNDLNSLFGPLDRGVRKQY